MDQQGPDAIHRGQQLIFTTNSGNGGGGVHNICILKALSCGAPRNGALQVSVNSRYPSRVTNSLPARTVNSTAVDFRKVTNTSRSVSTTLGTFWPTAFHRRSD